MLIRLYTLFKRESWRADKGEPFLLGASYILFFCNLEKEKIMTRPLMPKATAVWLIDNTALTFEQIAEFTGIHMLEIQAMADGDVSGSIVGFDPILNGQLTKEEIERCEKDAKASLTLVESDAAKIMRKAGAKYTPMSRRGDKPDAIMWLVKNHPELSDAQICKLIGTTKPSVVAIREKTHKNIAAIRPRNPVTLGLCTEANLEKAVVLAYKKNPDAIKASEYESAGLA